MFKITEHFRDADDDTLRPICALSKRPRSICNIGDKKKYVYKCLVLYNHSEMFEVLSKMCVVEDVTIRFGS